MAGKNTTPLCITASSDHSTITPARWLHVILLIVALAGWLIFILACIGGPAWSPDGSQILFAYQDVENSRTSVALYDRPTGAVTTIFAQPSPKESQIGLQPRWQTDGTRALIAIYRDIPGGSSDGACELISIPVKSSLPLQVYNLGSTDACINPYPQVNGKVYFGGKNLLSVDLTTGEVASKDFKVSDKSEIEAVALFQSSDRIYYQRKVTRNVNGTDKSEGGTEIGRFQVEDFTLKPLFTLWAQDLTALGVEDLGPIVWSRGSGMAMIGGATASDSDKILLAEEDKGVARTLVPDLGARPAKLGNLIWSSEGRTLYASAITAGEPSEQKDTLNYGVAEIPLDGSRARLTKIAPLRGAFDDDLQTTLRLSLLVSLSPDGRWIAATPAVLKKEALDDHDRALFLIDLHDPARAVHRVPIPHQPPATPAKEVKQ